jgi:hypothetical protein
MGWSFRVQTKVKGCEMWTVNAYYVIADTLSIEVRDVYTNMSFLRTRQRSERVASSSDVRFMKFCASCEKAVAMFQVPSHWNGVYGTLTPGDSRLRLPHGPLM